MEDSFWAAAIFNLWNSLRLKKPQTTKHCLPPPIKLCITLIYWGFLLHLKKEKKNPNNKPNKKPNKPPQKQQRKKCIFATQVKIPLSLFSFICKGNYHLLTITLPLYFSKFSIFRICIPSTTFIAIPLFCSLNPLSCFESESGMLCRTVDY